MRNFITKCLIFGFLLSLSFAGITSCTVRHTHHHHKTVVKKKRVPPGHAKKRAGHKSARKHAPGHR